MRLLIRVFVTQMRAHKMSLRFYVVLFIALLFTSLLGWQFVSAYTSEQMFLDKMMQAPSFDFLLGTDELGRDQLIRLSEGVSLSLIVGSIVAVICCVVGTLIGVISGYYKGWIDQLLMRITDVFLSFPGILMAIALAALMGPGIINLIYALCLMGWVGFARLARAQTLMVREQDYVKAAEITGVSQHLVLIKYILPNIAAPLIVEFSFSMAGAMLAEAGLSFLGLGVQAPTASLGAMLREGARYMLVAPHMVLAPGLCLMLLVLALNLLGDALRDKLDVRRIDKKQL